MRTSETFSLDDLYAFTRWEDGCLVWTAHMNNGHPQIRIDGRVRNVRRVLWELTKGAVQVGRQVGIHGKCVCGCVHPDHLRARWRASIPVKRSPDWKFLLVAGTRRSSDFCMEIAREIRASNESTVELAKQYGRSQSMISLIKSNKAWAEPSPFCAGLMGRRGSYQSTKGDHQ